MDKKKRPKNLKRKENKELIMKKITAIILLLTALIGLIKVIIELIKILI